jgi:hypothetical protein
LPELVLRPINWSVVNLLENTSLINRKHGYFRELHYRTLRR